MSRIPRFRQKASNNLPAKRAALVKDDALGNHLPLAHGGTQGGNRGARIDVVEEITEHIAARIIVQEGHLIELPPGRLVKDFFQAVAMPETMGMVACVEAPLGRRRGRRLGLLHGVFHPLDGRGTDLHLGDVLEFPGQAFRAQPRLHLDEAAGLLLHLAA